MAFITFSILKFKMTESFILFPTKKISIVHYYIFSYPYMKQHYYKYHDKLLIKNVYSRKY